METNVYSTTSHDVKESSNASCTPSDICRDDEQRSSLSRCQAKADHADAK